MGDCGTESDPISHLAHGADERWQVLGVVTLTDPHRSKALCLCRPGLVECWTRVGNTAGKNVTTEQAGRHWSTGHTKLLTGPIGVPPDCLRRAPGGAPWAADRNDLNPQAPFSGSLYACR